MVDFVDQMTQLEVAEMVVSEADSVEDQEIQAVVGQPL
jgi:hypothetical protein